MKPLKKRVQIKIVEETKFGVLNKRKEYKHYCELSECII